MADGYPALAYQLVRDFEDHIKSVIEANFNARVWVQFSRNRNTKLLAHILKSYDATLNADNHDPTQGATKAAIQDRITNYYRGLAQGTAQLPQTFSQEDLAALSTLTQTSIDVRNNVQGAHEVQSSNVSGTELASANPSGGTDLVQDAQQVNGKDLSRGSTAKAKGTGLAEQDADTLHIVTNDEDHTHAEIILLKAIVYHIIKINTIPKDTIYIAGRRVPCRSCQSILTEFELRNDGMVKIKYDTQGSAQQRNPNGVNAHHRDHMKLNQNQGNPENYANALQTGAQALKTDVETAIASEDTNKNVKRWLQKILGML